MKRLSLIALVLTLLAPSARAAEIVWLSLAGDLVYRDANHACEVKTLLATELTLALRAEGTKVSAAILRSGPPSLPTGRLELSAEELAATTVRTDERGQIWLTSLQLNGTSLAWVFTRLGQLDCPLPQPIASVGGGPHPFPFVKDIPPPGIGMQPSSRVVFGGTRGDGQPYRASLILLQRPY